MCQCVCILEHLYIYADIEVQNFWTEHQHTIIFIPPEAFRRIIFISLGVLMCLVAALAKLYRPGADPISQPEESINSEWSFPKSRKTTKSKQCKWREEKTSRRRAKATKQRAARGDGGALQPANVSERRLISFWLQRHPTRSSQVTSNCFSK